MALLSTYTSNPGPYPVELEDLLGAHCRVLLVLGPLSDLHSIRCTRNGDRHAARTHDSSVSGSHGVYDAFVDGPDLVPLLVGDVLAGALSDDVLPQGFNLQASPDDALCGFVILAG